MYIILSACTRPATPPVLDDTSTAMDDTGTDTDPPKTWRWEPISVDAIPPRWGSAVAGRFVVGGVDANLDVSDAIHAVDGSFSGALIEPRYCSCALFDSNRGELIVLGGRDRRYAELPTAEILHIDTGALSSLDDGGAADHPVGCHAWFSAEEDRGWIFGGGSSSGFSARLWRYDPAVRTFTELPADGPAGRYDAAVVQLRDGGTLLVSGMNGTGMLDDAWRFEPTTESFAEVTTTTTRPPGRRFPFAAESSTGAIVFGFGSDSSMGRTVLGDLWTLDLPTGEWTELTLPTTPPPRGFTSAWPGPDGSVGALAFGSDGQHVVEDAFALWEP